MVQFFRFSIVGTIGFVIDVAILLALLEGSDLGYYWGRLLSFIAAATVTWALNRSFTFERNPDAHRVSQWARFIAVNSIGGVINYGIYSLFVTFSLLAQEWPILAVAAGSIAGLAFNFQASRRLVFQQR
ncbi:MAG: GtrA family protein [Pseudomonadota bacterium]